MTQRITTDSPSQVEISRLHGYTRAREIRQYRFNLNALSGVDNENFGLAANPTRVHNSVLLQFPEFQEFLTKSRVATEPVSAPGKAPTSPSSSIPSLPNQIVTGDSRTPDEILRATIKQIDEALSRELLDRILTSPPAFFESAVVSLLLAMGYGGSREEAGRAIGRSGDGGLDGVVDQDALGLDRVYVQAKRYSVENPVSEPEVRAFSGSLGAAKANKGVFVTTSYFTRPARDFAERHPFKLILIDGEHLTRLMIRYNVGIRIEERIDLKKIDEDFFTDL